MTDKDDAPPPFPTPDRSRYHGFDPIFAELAQLHCDAIWVNAYHSHFCRWRETEPELAESELRYVGEAITDCKKWLDGLTTFVLARETIDLSKPMPPGFTAALSTEEAKLHDPRIMALRPRQLLPDFGSPLRTLIDPAAIPRPGEGPYDCRYKDVDAVAWALSRVRCYTMWWDEHHRSFLALRESDPKLAEDELGYLTSAIADITPYRDRLTELLLAGYTIDPSKRMPRLDFW